MSAPQPPRVLRFEDAASAVEEAIRQGGVQEIWNVYARGMRAVAQGEADYALLRQIRRRLGFALDPQPTPDVGDLQDEIRTLKAEVAGWEQFWALVQQAAQGDAQLAPLRRAARRVGLIP